MPDIILKVVFGLLTKLVTETFIARVAIYSANAWAKTTVNKLDDKVVGAMADAIGVPLDDVKALQGPGTDG